MLTLAVLIVITHETSTIGKPIVQPVFQSMRPLGRPDREPPYFLRAVERSLREHSPGCGASAGIGAVAFIHRFGSSLNEPVHFHCCVIDGVFEPATETHDEEGVVFHAPAWLDTLAIADVQARVRRRVLRAFVRRGLTEKDDADKMGGWDQWRRHVRRALRGSTVTKRGKRRIAIDAMRRTPATHLLPGWVGSNRQQQI